MWAYKLHVINKTKQIVNHYNTYEDLLRYTTTVLTKFHKHRYYHAYHDVQIERTEKCPGYSKKSTNGVLVQVHLRR